MPESIYKPFEVESFHEIRDDSIGLKGYLVIGSRINGLTCGGLRIHDAVSPQELKDHAKVMELKQTFLSLPRGGARAGIVAPYGLSEHSKQGLMNRFAELVHEELIDRRWLVAIDIGTNIDLVHNMYKHVGVEIPKPSKSIANAGLFTAMGVIAAIRYCLGTQDKQISGRTFAIEGMGNVGSNLAKLLSESGGVITAASNVETALYNPEGLDIEEMMSLRQSDSPVVVHRRTQIMTPPELLELPVDVLCPCATDSTIHSGNVSRLNTEIICAGANNPVTFAALQYLHDKDILYLPDFITNSGGALGNMTKFAGLGKNALDTILDGKVVPELQEIHVQSRNNKIAPAELAYDLLNVKFSTMKSRAEQQSNKQRIREVMLSAYRSGWVPKFLVRPIALRKIYKSIGVTAT